MNPLRLKGDPHRSRGQRPRSVDREYSPCKGKPMASNIFWSALSGRNSFWNHSEGVALGYDCPGLWPVENWSYNVRTIHA